MVFGCDLGGGRREDLKNRFRCGGSDGWGGGSISSILAKGFGGVISSIGPDKGHDIECLVLAPTFPIIQMKKFLDLGKSEGIRFPFINHINTAIMGLDGGFLHAICL